MMGKVLLILTFGLIAVMLQPALNAQEEDWEEVLDIVSGKVTNIDLTTNKLTITDIDGAAQEFDLDPNLTTVWDDTADEERELSDLVIDKQVVVEFRVDENGSKIASWIDIVAEEVEVEEATEEVVGEEE